MLIPAQVNGTITFVRNENMSYPACPLQYAGRTCNKKCTDGGGGDNWCVSKPKFLMHLHQTDAEMIDLAPQLASP